MSTATAGTATSLSTSTLASTEMDASIQQVPFKVNGSIAAFQTPWSTIPAQISLHANQVQWRRGRWNKLIQKARVKENSLHMFAQRALRKEDDLKAAEAKIRKLASEREDLLKQVEETRADVQKLLQLAWVLKKGIFIDDERAGTIPQRGDEGHAEDVKCITTATTDSGHMSDS